MIGLGRMGLGMSRRLSKRGHEVWGFDVSLETRERAKEHIRVLEGLEELKDQEEKIIWLMVPHEVVDEAINSLRPYLKTGNIIIDGGNSYYKDSQRR